MTVERQQRSGESSDSTRWQRERAPKLLILKTSQALFSRELTEAEFSFWTTVLDDCSVAELRFAFDNWNRNGRYFPKPKDVLEQVEVYRQTVPKNKYGYPDCDAICKAQHGKGYSGEDILWLWKRYNDMLATLPNRAMTEAEVDGLLRELDSRRKGGAPEWRKRA